MQRTGSNFMSSKPKDQRPKIISFHNTLDGLNIAAKQGVLWPCHAFSISIPQKKKSGLNVFEETVLKITEIESGDTDKIALVTCLEKELVAFIQNRLNHLNLLNSRNELSEEGKKLLESRRNNSEGNVEYVAGTVFVDLVNGKLLPYIHMCSLKYEKITQIYGESAIKFTVGSTGRSIEIHGEIIPVVNDYKTVVPGSNNIIRAIREFKKKHKRYSLLRQSFDQYPPSVPMAEAISVQENPELVYLHCDALIQLGNSDLLVTDGCGLGFSESFARYLTSQDLPWITEMKKKGVVEKKNSTKNEDYSFGKPQNIYPIITKLFKHPKIGINIALYKLNDSTKTEHEEREYVSSKQQIASKLYSSIEYALSFIVAEYPVPEWEEIFSNQNYKNNEKLLYGFAEKIGLILSPKNRQLLQVKAGAIRHIQEGKVKLQPLLAIAIVGASTKYSNHPFYDLARNYPGFIDLVLALKKLRDPIAHGDITDYKQDAKQLKSRIKQTKAIIITLLPSIAVELSDNDISRITEDDINQDRLKAETQLDEFFGPSFVYEMDRELKEQLLRIELLFAQPIDDLITIEIINALAAAMQTILQLKLQERRTSGNTRGGEDSKESALNKIVEAGFCDRRNSIPASIATVRSSFVDNAIRGYGASLGADFLGIIASSDDEITQLHKEDSTIVHFISDLLNKRGDGNNIHQTFSEDEIILLKNNVFKAIKLLTEVF